MRHGLHTHVTNDASTEVVWQVLVDLDEYCD